MLGEAQSLTVVAKVEVMISLWIICEAEIQAFKRSMPTLYLNHRPFSSCDLNCKQEVRVVILLLKIRHFVTETSPKFFWHRTNSPCTSST
jgi:hypothetical protein